MTGNDRCSEVDWESALSRPGWANCTLGSYISGVWRENDAVISSLPDGIDNIKMGQCCSPPHEYKDDTPACQTLDWKTSLSRSVTMNLLSFYAFALAIRNVKRSQSHQLAFCSF